MLDIPALRRQRVANGTRRFAQETRYEITGQLTTDTGNGKRRDRRRARVRRRQRIRACVSRMDERVAVGVAQ